MPEMNRILVLHAHPAPHRSRIHRSLSAAIQKLPGITFRDLYEAYPNFDIDVVQEQALLRDHQVVVYQHPVYWYSTPAILQEWQEEVLARGFAYGPGGDALRGKALTQALSTGGTRESYRHDGEHGFTLSELLRPVEQTARFCGMDYLAPFVVQGGGALSEHMLDEHARRYRSHLETLRDGPLPAPFNSLET